LDDLLENVGGDVVFEIGAIVKWYVIGKFDIVIGWFDVSCAECG